MNERPIPLSDRAAAMVLLLEAIERGKGVEAIRILNGCGYGTGTQRDTRMVDWPKARNELQGIVGTQRYQY